MSQTKSAAHIVTGEVRLAFPALFEPQPPMKGDTSGKLVYQATLLLPVGYDLKPLYAAMQAAAAGNWGGNVPKMSPSKNPIKAFDGESSIAGFEPGMHMIRTKSNFQPPVVDQRVQPILDANLIYAGCYVKAAIHAFGWTHATGGNGISFGLDAIQFIRNGERIDGRLNVGTTFEPVAFDESDALPTGGPPDGAAGDAAAAAMFG